MTDRKTAGILALVIALFAATPAQAYVGPGLGAGAFAAVAGIFTAIGAAFLGIVWYPIKRVLKKGKAKGKSGDAK